MPTVSPLSAVHPRAELAAGVEVGPFCTIGPDVRIGPGTKLVSHVVVAGHTTLGARNTIYPHAVLGTAPQDKKYRGGPTTLEIGDDNAIREAVTLHLGTELGGGVTRIGSSNLLMVNVHIGHDSILGDHNIIANNTLLAGHVVIENHVNLGGAVGINAFVTIGDFAFVAAHSRVTHDVPPYCKVDGPNLVRGINAVGMRRGGISEDDIAAIESAWRRLFFYRDGPLSAALEAFDDAPAAANGHPADGVAVAANPHVQKMVEFLRRRDQGKYGRYLESLRTHPIRGLKR